jgi:hypothetical protein
MAAGAYAMGALADQAGMGSIFLAGAVFSSLTLLGYLLLDRKGFFRVPGLQVANKKFSV